MSAIIIGLKNIHVAEMLTDNETETTYDTPKRLALAIEAKIKPNVNTATLYADDGPAATDSSLGEIEVELNIDSLPTEMQEFLLGHTVNAEGVLIKKSDDQAPYVALGFNSPTSDGQNQYVWLYKGKFELPEANYKTKGESIEYQTPTITGKFIKREFDNAWKATVMSGDAGVSATVIMNWFTGVYKETA
ncbi:major tail protein [Chengkuizengella sp. SCS-71B]|uniref:major tail protein n=1 Tax=Chengkuizengella sp. SCS-71B TaxID=3115290 RepID=UPI0032C23968